MAHTVGVTVALTVDNGKPRKSLQNGTASADVEARRTFRESPVQHAGGALHRALTLEMKAAACRRTTLVAFPETISND